MAITSECPNDPAPLLMHCASGDDDLGTHALEFNEARFWHFGDNFFGRTLFHCHFKWDTKETSVDVYNRHIRGLCKPATVRDYSCYCKNQLVAPIHKEGVASCNNGNEYEMQTEAVAGPC
ncbi:hypothetical protein RHMOL_Rhmol09G0045600 [Rhododendron molle]|uniref:Uncharacterized protein n=1 Tax=Rhododendron molle TaxID=49168 RepID=A0ACC0MAW3_RHOML|nr:hypothetical protein RHMOL_Rhmol09G0045600 [Rhododendron molle]